MADHQLLNPGWSRILWWIWIFSPTWIHWNYSPRTLDKYRLSNRKKLDKHGIFRNDTWNCLESKTDESLIVSVEAFSKFKMAAANVLVLEKIRNYILCNLKCLNGCMRYHHRVICGQIFPFIYWFWSLGSHLWLNFIINASSFLTGE